MKEAGGKSEQVFASEPRWARFFTRRGPRTEVADTLERSDGMRHWKMRGIRYARDG